MTSLVRCGAGDILVEKLKVKTTFWGRLRGLMFHRNLDADSAVLLVATKRVHTCGMLFPVDLYFFDASLVLIGFQQCVMPWSLPLSPRSTEHILEVQHRTDIEPLKIALGERVSLFWNIRP